MDPQQPPPGRGRTRGHPGGRARLHPPDRRRARARPLVDRGLRRHRARDAPVPRGQDPAQDAAGDQPARLLPGDHRPDPGLQAVQSVRGAAALPGPRRARPGVGRSGRRPLDPALAGGHDHPGRGPGGDGRRVGQPRGAGPARARGHPGQGRGAHLVPVEGPARSGRRCAHLVPGGRAGGRRRPGRGRSARVVGRTRRDDRRPQSGHPGLRRLRVEPRPGPRLPRLRGQAPLPGWQHRGRPPHGHGGRGPDGQHVLLLGPGGDVRPGHHDARRPRRPR